MKSQVYIVAGLVIIIALLAGSIFFIGKNDTEKKNIENNSAQSGPPKAPRDESMVGFEASPRIAIEYRNSGFFPQENEVSFSGSVEFYVINSTEEDIEVIPVGKSDAQVQISLGVIEAGQSRGITLLEPGTYLFANKLNPEHTGSLILEKR